MNTIMNSLILLYAQQIVIYLTTVSTYGILCCQRIKRSYIVAEKLRYIFTSSRIFILSPIKYYMFANVTVILKLNIKKTFVFILIIQRSSQMDTLPLFISTKNFFSFIIFNIDGLMTFYLILLYFYSVEIKFHIIHHQINFQTNLIDDGRKRKEFR